MEQKKSVDIWFSSDAHFGHTNIVGEEVSVWKSGYRDFKTLHEMNVTLTETYNKYVKEDDHLYFLGDWSFGGLENIFIFRQLIKCKNIYFVYGNHDHHIKNNKNDAKSLFLYCSNVMTPTINKQKFFLSHYAHQVWAKHHEGVIHLFGHSHGTLPGVGKSMDVGVDEAYKRYKEYRPFHINEILENIYKKEIHVVDHHNDRTT